MVQVYPTREGSIIEIRVNRPFPFVTYTLTDPDRLVVDPVDLHIESVLPGKSLLHGGLIPSWRIARLPPAAEEGGQARLPDAELPGEIDYLEFQLDQPSEHLVESTEGGLLIRVRSKGQTPANSDLSFFPGPLAAPPDFSNPNAFSKEPTGVWSLDRILESGSSRHRPIQIARLEIELAQMKLREARRNLYPTATLKTSWTDGTASKVDFREFSGGVQVEHPLYYSGRLQEAYRQALVNFEVAEKRQGKAKADFALEVGQAYFQLIGAKISLAAQEGLVGTASDFVEKSRARFDKGLLTRLEVLNVEAQTNQARFQRVTAESDVTMARFKLLQRLNLAPDALVEVPDQFPPLPERQVDLEEAIRLADRYRLDIQVNGLLVQFQEHEVRIAQAKGRLKLDLSGFFGTSGAAFQTEKLDLGDDYFVGLKATQAWGPHGATLSFTDTHTSPRLGQTTRTDSAVYSGELGLFTQLPGLSEIQQARVNLEKARNEMEESRQAVFQEVQEAIISTTKAKLQLEYAKQKIAFREEQLKILQAQASLNEALPSQVLEATLKLTEERVGEAQALTNLHVALAKLNKAIGLPGYYKSGENGKSGK